LIAFASLSTEFSRFTVKRSGADVGDLRLCVHPGFTLRATGCNPRCHAIPDIGG
jgi:hypothetical protein